MSRMLKTKSSYVLTQIQHALVSTDERDKVEYMGDNGTDASTQVTSS